MIPSREPENIPAHSTNTWSETRARRGQENISGNRHVALANYARFLSRDIVMRRIVQHMDGRPLNLSRKLHKDLLATSESSRAPAAAGNVQDDPSSPEFPSASPIRILNHLTATGEAHMVSISGKTSTVRSATATTVLLFSHPQTYNALLAARLRKGDALAVARIAGIQAAKKTPDLIPLAHPGLDITAVYVRLVPFLGDALPYPLKRSSLSLGLSTTQLYGGVVITATVTCEGKTGVEMEAMTSASVAGLTMYDMLKAVDKAMVLTATRVVAKSGGKSGDWIWDEKTNKIVKDETAKLQALHKQSQELRGQDIQKRVAARRAELDLDAGAPVPDDEPHTSSHQQDGVVVRRIASTPGRVSTLDLQASRQRRLARLLEARRRRNTSVSASSTNVSE